ncbi:MAG: prohibitin family protein [Clostridia bacterium]|nr:prohibitin family protein [Clostridia bacterium]
MMTILMAGVLGALCVLCIGLAVKKHNSTGKTPVFMIALALVFALVLVVVPFSIHIVNTGEVAVVKHMGEAKDVKTAGMHFDLWLITQYDYYDSKVQNVEIVTSAYSSDAQTMDIAMTLQYQISTDKAIDIANQYGNLDALQSRIEAIAIEKTKSVLSSYKAMDIISDRASMSPKVEEAIINAITDEYFVTVSTVVLTNIDFSDAFEKAVEEKMIAEQKKLQAEYENEMKVAAAEAEKEAAIQKAEGEAKAKLIAAEAEREAQVELSRADAISIQLKSVEIARALGFKITEKQGVDEDGVAVIEYEIDFTGKSADEIALITDYLKYIEYLAKWDGKLPTDMSGYGASIVLPIEP